MPLDPPRSTQLLTRRAFTRLSASALELAGTGLLTATPASAGISWCRTDPVIDVNGRRVHIYVLGESPTILDQTLGAKGPTDVTVYAPPGTTAQLTAMDSGFNGYGYKVQLQKDDKLKVNPDGTIQLKVVVKVPAWTSVPIMVEADPYAEGLTTTSVTGATNVNTAALFVTI